MKRTLSLASGTVALFLAAVLSYAQTEDAAKGRGHHRLSGRSREESQKRREAAKAELGLTEAQEADIAKLRETSKADRVRVRTELKEARQGLKALLQADTVDEKAVNAKVADVQAAEGALTKLRVDSVLGMKRILTPEQQKKVLELRESRHAHKESRVRDGQRFHKNMQRRRALRSGGASSQGGTQSNDDDEVVH